MFTNEELAIKMQDGVDNFRIPINVLDLNSIITNQLQLDEFKRWISDSAENCTNSLCRFTNC